MGRNKVSENLNSCSLVSTRRQNYLVRFQKGLFSWKPSCAQLKLCYEIRWGSYSSTSVLHERPLFVWAAQSLQDMSSSHYVLISGSSDEEMASFQATRRPNSRLHFQSHRWTFLRRTLTFAAVTVATETGILSRTVMFSLTQNLQTERVQNIIAALWREKGGKFNLNMKTELICGLSHDFLLRRRNNHKGH